MLKKLSYMNYKIDKASTVSINDGNGNIIKISPTEILTIADQIIKQQTIKSKLNTAKSIYQHALEALEIPQDVIENITQRLLYSEHNTTQENNTNNTLLQFVKTFVNENSPENEFEKEEFDPFNINIQDLETILDKHGLSTEIKKDTIIIRLNGEKNDQ